MSKDNSNKRYYWLKLKDDFFYQPKIKKLRRIAGGDTYTVIYLKLQLLSLNNGGILVYEGIENSFAEEISLKVDEETDNVAVTLEYLLTQGLMEECNCEYMLPETMMLIGSETASTIRSQKSREKKKMLQCNSDATNCNEETRDKEIDIEKNIETRLIDCHFGPTRIEVNNEIREKGYKTVSSDKFYNCYENTGWMWNGKPIKNWKLLLKSWENGKQEYASPMITEKPIEEVNLEELRARMFGKDRIKNGTV